MEAVAKAKYVRISPRKARLMAKAVQGLKAEEALNKLMFTPKKSAFLFTKVIKSAVANASQNEGADVDSLYIKHAYVDGGPTLKRWRPRAMGRAYVIRKRTSHITVVVAER
ncbi:50S ribosomal protein L22 [Dethiosulfatarculus sandiegensis]|jgi:large subunit ribosomal protein L22|uniref:Large ribosomal subunit protein uL22 n=1 Tax=Dethiosulfatarculus sandiegensis TaxID=1429043 RepID=A0A0D2I0C5_9BACT|nr:50S ribosomal protein L22 [Dethiosulfatarculus sandiegensis]KIX15958.1 50S ribosomal protein L22 [Dethiosulfatarculus sandiegensis]